MARSSVRATVRPSSPSLGPCPSFSAGPCSATGRCRELSPSPPVPTDRLSIVQGGCGVSVTAAPIAPSPVRRRSRRDKPMGPEPFVFHHPPNHRPKPWNPARQRLRNRERRFDGRDQGTPPLAGLFAMAIIPGQTSSAAHANVITAALLGFPGLRCFLPCSTHAAAAAAAAAGAELDLRALSWSHATLVPFFPRIPYFLGNASVHHGSKLPQSWGQVHDGRRRRRPLRRPSFRWSICRYSQDGLSWRCKRAHHIILRRH